MDKFTTHIADKLELPAALYVVVAADDELFDDGPFIFVHSGRFDSLTDAEAFIYEYGTRYCTYSIFEYALPPF